MVSVETDLDEPARVPEGMAGLAKGLAILEAFPANGGRMTVADAARASSTTRASARRCLLTMAELGYLEYDGKFFRPQPRILSLGKAYSTSRSLPQVAQPILLLARDELEESVSLAIMDGDSALFIARADAARLISSGISIGARAPAYCSATGKVLLGGWSDERVLAYLTRTNLVARTAHTLVDKAKILSEVKSARANGYAISDEELELGLRSIAVCVLNSHGDLSGAMSASVSSARISRKQMIALFLPILKRNAEKLGRAL